jgi:hypothetical protein
MNPGTIDRIAQAAATLRPDWPAASTASFIRKHCSGWPAQDLAVALTACALATKPDGTWLATTPRFVLDDQWRQLMPNARNRIADEAGAQQERADRLEAQRLAQLEAQRCTWCDEHGYLGNGARCLHVDPNQLAARAAAHAATARAQIRPAPRPNQPEHQEQTA